MNTKKSVIIWLVTGLILVYLQIVIGGMTRLTGSGLSITKWEIVTGTVPPLNAEQWEEAFALYKETPQYAQINEGMSMKQFKSIYFWEYLHRLWARGMGFVFIIPLLYFLGRGWIPKLLGRRLIVIFLLAATAAVFGWIMVASGLVERPWVNAYKLALHLGIALSLYGYLFWTILKMAYPRVRYTRRSGVLRWFVTLMVIQILLGALMSGMKASLWFPTFPDYQGSILPDVLWVADAWTVENIVQYDRSALMPALVQVAHRTLAYMLIISGLYIVWKGRKPWKEMGLLVAPYLLVTMLVIQGLLGVWVLVGSVGIIPVLPGVLHQGVAIILLTIVLYLIYFSELGQVLE